MTSFAATGAQLTRFFSLATINYNIEQICVDVKDDRLFTSAIIEKGRHCWTMVKCNAEVSSEGSFVLNTTDLKKCSFKPKETYSCAAKDGVLTLRTERSKLTIQLASFDDHTDPDNENSSYVMPEPKVDARWNFGLMIDEDHEVPIPKAPPNKGKDYDGPLQQMLSISSSDLKSMVKTASSFGSKGMTLETNAASYDLIVTVNDAHVSASEKIECLPVTAPVINWEQAFQDPIKDIINLAGEQIILAMTDHYTPRHDLATKEEVEGSNFGLWIVLADDGMTACYHLSVVEER